jgi:sporulation protein YlmC with PRC-barrel domain
MNQRTDIPLGKNVYCTDGLAGRSSHLILYPLNRRATHLVVRKRHFPHSDHVVPIELVAETNRSLIRLSCSTHELTLLDPFTETRFVRVDPLEVDYPFDPLLMWPYVTPEEELLPVDEERVPPGELAVSRGARVHTAEGEYVGCVDEFLVNPTDECITHLVVREGHPWNRKEVMIPVSQVVRMAEETVYLKRVSSTTPTLPSWWRAGNRSPSPRRS